MRRDTIPLFIIYILFVFACWASCSTSRNYVSSSTYEVDKVLDLKGDTLFLPQYATLVFKGNGCLKNGIIVGRETKIKSSSTHFFEHVQIKGEWIVPEIKSEFFKDIDNDDVLKEVFALASDRIKNVIRLERREYWVSVNETGKKALTLKSNTKLINNGTIKLRPNSLISYAIIEVRGSNIVVIGGQYVGDKDMHRGVLGEWGHGIQVTGGSCRVLINNVYVRDCWGDGIAVDGNKVNTNVIINGFKVDNCRRQGISVIFADNCIISNGSITNIQGTEPHLGIDIEPNANGYCHNITIDNVTIESEKGLGVFTATKDFQVNDVIIKDCKINASGYSSIYAARCDGLIIKNNYLSCSASGNNPVISINRGVRKCQLLSNTINYNGDDNSNCCVFNSGEFTLIQDNSISSSSGVAFYTSDALISKNTISSTEVLTSANNATGNSFRNNKVLGNLTCTAGGNVFENNVFKGNIRLNGYDCVFSDNEVHGKSLSGTLSNGQLTNNKVFLEEVLELNGNVTISSNEIRAPKVILKTGTKATNNTFVHTNENDSDSFITLYGDSFEDNIVRTKISEGSSTVTYIYCTSDGTTIKNNKFAAAPGIKYWLYSSKNLKLKNNRPAKKQIYQAGENSIIE